MLAELVEYVELVVYSSTIITQRETYKAIRWPIGCRPCMSGGNSKVQI